MPEGESDEIVERREAKSRTANMRNAAFIIFLIGYNLIAKVWAFYGYFNTWFYLEGYILLAIVLLFFLTPPMVKNRSPKLITNKIGTTVSVATPVAQFPAQAGWPDMGVWPADTVKGYGIYEMTMTCKGYVIAPLSQVYAIGEEGKQGVNVFVNTWLEEISDHSELAPHILEGLKKLKRPAYNPDVRAYVGIFPILTHKLTKEDMESFQQRFEQLGISKELFLHGKDGIGIVNILEDYSAKASYFNPNVDFKTPEKVLDTQLKSAHTMIEQLRRDNRFYRSELTAVQDLHKYSKEPDLPPSLREKFDRYTQQEQAPSRDGDERSGRQ